MTRKPDVKTDGKRLAGMREAAGLTQPELAAAVGVHAVTVSKWETGSQGIKGKHLPAIARALGVSTDTLLGLSESGVPRETSAPKPPSTQQKAAAFDAIVALVAATLGEVADAATVERRMASYLEYLQITRERDPAKGLTDTGT